MPEYVVVKDRWFVAPEDDTDPQPHHEHRRGDVLELEDNDHTQRYLDAGHICTREAWDDAQVDPSTLPPSGDIVAGRGGEGDRPVLAEEGPEPTEPDENSESGGNGGRRVGGKHGKPAGQTQQQPQGQGQGQQSGQEPSNETA